MGREKSTMEKLEIKNKKYIYCYYISSDYNFSEMLVSISSLIAVHPRYPIAVAYGPKVSQASLDILKDLNLILLNETDHPLAHKVITAEGKEDLFECSAKLYLYRRTEYDKIIYLDPDTLFLQNIDEIFEYSDGSATKHFMDNKAWPGMNGGLMVIEPNKQIFDEFIKQLKKDELSRKHEYPDDQYYLTLKNNFIYRQDKHIPYIYNFFPFFLNQYRQSPIFDEGAIKMWHFMGNCTFGQGSLKVFNTYSLRLFPPLAQDYMVGYINTARRILTIYKLKYNANSLIYPGLSPLYEE